MPHRGDLWPRLGNPPILGRRERPVVVSQAGAARCVGAKSAMLRFPWRGNLRPLPCPSSPNRNPLRWASVWVRNLGKKNVGACFARPPVGATYIVGFAGERSSPLQGCISGNRTVHILCAGRTHHGSSRRLQCAIAFYLNYRKVSIRMHWPPRRRDSSAAMAMKWLSMESSREVIPGRRSPAR